jgi:hypothetical protein
MRDWIVVIILYALGMGLFQVLGGLGAAANALSRWGRASSSLPDEQPSSSA